MTPDERMRRAERTLDGGDPLALYEACQLRMRNGEEARGLAKEFAEGLVDAIPREDLLCIERRRRNLEAIKGFPLEAGLLRPGEGRARYEFFLGVLCKSFEAHLAKRIKEERAPLEVLAEFLRNGAAVETAKWLTKRLFDIRRLPRGSGKVIEERVFDPRIPSDWSPG